MKKFLLVVVLLLLIGALGACVPTEPQDMIAYCKEIHEQDFPNYPPAFVGACVAFLQTEKPTALVSLCGSAAFRAELNDPDGLNAGVENRQECITFLHNLEE